MDLRTEMTLTMIKADSTSSAITMSGHRRTNRNRPALQRTGDLGDNMMLFKYIVKNVASSTTRR